MTKSARISLLLLRVSLGWLFFYAGITKVINPAWSAKGYLLGAKTFPALFHLFASDQWIGAINFVNEWGLTLLGISLILGIFVRLSSVLGCLLMVLYYLPILQFPYPDKNSFIVDQHVIFIFILVYFIAAKAGRTLGLDSLLLKSTFLKRFQNVLGWVS